MRFFSAVDPIEEDIESQMRRTVTTQRSGETRDGSIDVVGDREFEPKLEAVLRRSDFSTAVKAASIVWGEVVDDPASGADGERCRLLDKCLKNSLLKCAFWKPTLTDLAAGVLGISHRKIP
ncbi:hypothetical protein [Halomarina rubra]|uniref:Uncharacterized protein n=1 Tax=Halomarina rubra TaxID=2071873 RepID=A0ABD6AY12_9EURY|nr:hypothetical protein [Halomarina rubra]